jgi:hypothetical protein
MSVDGETYWQTGGRAGTNGAKRLLDFLSTYGHEGSTIELDVFDRTNVPADVKFGAPEANLRDEDAYNLLKLDAGVPRG